MIRETEILNYIVNHPKKDKTLPDWTTVSISRLVHDASLANGLMYYKNNHKIEGVACCFPNPDTKFVWVTAILCDSKAAFQFFVRVFQSMYPDYVIAARRRKKQVCYGKFKTNRLCHLILT